MHEWFQPRVPRPSDCDKNDFAIDGTRSATDGEGTCLRRLRVPADRREVRAG
jgi:hypothetical protein